MPQLKFCQLLLNLCPVNTKLVLFSIIENFNLDFPAIMTKCNLFEYRCGDPSNMYSHVKYVHGKHQFLCNLCDSVFNRNENLKKHIKTKHGASGPQLFPCIQCDYKAMQKSHLTRHVKFTHESQEFPCDYCDKVYGRKDKLNAHVKKYHSKKEVY